MRENPSSTVPIDPESTQLNQGVERVFHNSVVDPVPVWGVCLPQAVIEEVVQRSVADCNLERLYEH